MLRGRGGRGGGGVGVLGGCGVVGAAAKELGAGLDGVLFGRGERGVRLAGLSFSRRREDVRGGFVDAWSPGGLRVSYPLLGLLLQTAELLPEVGQLAAEVLHPPKGLLLLVSDDLLLRELVVVVDRPGEGGQGRADLAWR